MINLETRNDIDFKNLLTKLRASLVDHHVLAVKNQLLDQYVVEIFDHRPIDKSVKWKQDVKRRIEQVGSCSTLICDEILKNCKELTNDLAKLLYGKLKSLYHTFVIDFNYLQTLLILILLDLNLKQIKQDP